MPRSLTPLQHELLRALAAAPYRTIRREHPAALDHEGAWVIVTEGSNPEPTSVTWSTICSLVNDRGGLLRMTPGNTEFGLTRAGKYMAETGHRFEPDSDAALWHQQWRGEEVTPETIDSLRPSFTGKSFDDNRPGGLFGYPIIG